MKNLVKFYVISLVFLIAFSTKSIGADKLIRRFWPGPLTLILRTDYDFPEGTVKDDGWVGFRIPNLEFRATS